MADIPQDNLSKKLELHASQADFEKKIEVSLASTRERVRNEREARRQAWRESGSSPSPEDLRKMSDKQFDRAVKDFFSHF